ncbi:unnamed protein product [Arabis nemorensis]|uniref:Uncharacterized protein n=1 Tax=Arabis nemorensis TaxID=586526 RepID=A0A565C130_9BRAS|nr:unnamed protein product [Arabis nemorensis]
MRSMGGIIGLSRGNRLRFCLWENTPSPRRDQNQDSDEILDRNGVERDDNLKGKSEPDSESDGLRSRKSKSKSSRRRRWYDGYGESEVGESPEKVEIR